MNPIIAQDFADSAEGALHMFLQRKHLKFAGRPQRNWIELRKFSPAANRPFNIFVSIIMPEYIGIIKVTSGWKTVLKKREGYSYREDNEFYIKKQMHMILLLRITCGQRISRL